MSKTSLASRERFGAELARLRRDAGVHQRRLAQHLGISNGTLSNIETVKREPLRPAAIVKATAFIDREDHCIDLLVRAWRDRGIIEVPVDIVDEQFLYCMAVKVAAHLRDQATPA